MQGGDVCRSNHPNYLFLVSILVVCVFEKYGLLANVISYNKFLFVRFYKTSEDALRYEIVCDDWGAFGVFSDVNKYFQEYV